ncbi:helix-turn-helix domain-containing protein [Azospirillum halopraeferens]|uniref:helix-turn-helix domain-containing protein n=1 Tax=Azospirillum halopraeferens TaxID=34010 RepID=UPI000413EA6A|nr:helix-turn-helix domain-containing protein [Azospirillum halopraeferens]
MICILDRWTHTATVAGHAVVFPDGCRDLIVVRHPDGRVTGFVSDLQTGPRSVAIRPGDVLTGRRLMPGACIDTGTLIARVPACDGDPAGIDDLVGEHCHVPAAVGEAVPALADEGATVAGAARSLGVSPRSLQRLFRTHGLPAPEFWLLLARARRAAARILPEASLADVAAAAGYADQAHMTRDFRRWFGLPPAALRRAPALLELLRQSGLGTAGTGEQISTR